MHPCRDHHGTARLESRWVATEGGDGDQIAGVPRQGVAELAPPQAADHVGVLSGGETCETETERIGPWAKVEQNEGEVVKPGFL